MSVIDTAAHKQLRSAQGSLIEGEGNLLDRIIKEIVGLLDLAMTDEAQAALRSGGTNSAEAASLYAQGLQSLPIRPAAPPSNGRTRSAAWSRPSRSSRGLLRSIPATPTRMPAWPRRTSACSG